MDQDHDDQGGTAAAQDMPEDGDFIAEEDVVAEFEVGDEQDRMAEDAVEDDAVEDEDGGDGEDRVAVEDMAMATFKGHSDAVYCVAANPKNPSQVATGGGDDKGFLWEVGKDGAIAASRELTGHSDSVASVGFSADGSLVATGCYGGIVKVWECSTGSLKHTLEGPEDIEWLTWHSLGSVLLAGSQDGTVWMWDAVAGTCMQVFAGHEKKVSCGTFTSSGKAVVTGSDDGTVRVWAPRTGECRHSFGGHGFHEGAVTCLARHPDPAQSPLIATGGEDGTARVVHIQTKRVLGTLVHCQAEEGSVEAVGFCASHPWVGTAATDGNLKVWDSVTGSCRHTCSHPGPVTNLEWHPSQPFVFTSCVDGGVRAWDARVGTCDKVWTGHTDMILDLRLMDPLPWIQDGGIVQGMGASNSSAAGESDQAVAILTASDDHTSKVFFWTLPAQQGQSSSSAPGEGAIARLEGP